MEQSGSIKKIMLAYSGGLDTSAMYEDAYLLGTSLARPPIARAQVLAAKECGADCLAHGSTGKGNDQVRFELTYQALAPEIKILAPWRLWNFTSRSDLIEYSHQNAIPITSTLEKPYSIDQNLMHTSYEGGILEDPWNLAPTDIFLTTVDPLKAPDDPEILRLEFSKGLPISLDGVSLAPTDLIRELNVTRRIEKVQLVGFTILHSIYHLNGRGLDRNPTLTL